MNQEDIQKFLIDKGTPLTRGAMALVREMNPNELEDFQDMIFFYIESPEYKERQGRYEDEIDENFEREMAYREVIEGREAEKKEKLQMLKQKEIEDFVFSVLSNGSRLSKRTLIREGQEDFYPTDISNALNEMVRRKKILLDESNLYYLP